MRNISKTWISSCLAFLLLQGTASAMEFHFDDASQVPWAATSIQKLYEEGIIKGVSDTEFDPNGTMTRAQFATILSSTVKSNGADKAPPFTDIHPDQWFYEPVKKMYSMGIIKGVDETQFDPYKTISREEAAVIFARTFDYPHSGRALSYLDKDRIDSWALNGIQAGTVKGLYGLYGDYFQPQRVITRAEAAVILHRILYGDPAPYVAPAPKPQAKPTLASRSSGMMTQRLDRVVQSVLGVPYKYGGTTTSGMDCSGFTSYVYKQLGVDLPRRSQDQISVGEKVSESNMQPGDLIFFDTGSGSISHVAIYMGNDQIAHAPSGGECVRMDNIDWYLNHYRVVGVKRVLG